MHNWCWHDTCCIEPSLIEARFTDSCLLAHAHVTIEALTQANTQTHTHSGRTWWNMCLLTLNWSHCHNVFVSSVSRLTQNTVTASVFSTNHRKATVMYIFTSWRSLCLVSFSNSFGKIVDSTVQLGVFTILIPWSSIFFFFYSGCCKPSKKSNMYKCQWVG